MKLAAAVANEIANRAKLVLKRSILVSDNQGHLIGVSPSSDHVEVDALRACQEGRVVRGEIDETSVVWCPFVYEHQTIGAFGIIETESQTTPEAINLLQGLAEVITHQHFLLEHVQPTDAMRAKFLKQALTSNVADNDEVFRQADILQLNIRVPQAIILLEIEGFEDSVAGDTTGLPTGAREQAIHEAARPLVEMVDDAFKHNSENIVCYFGKNQFAISKGIGGEGLTTRNTARFLVEKAEYIHHMLQKQLPEAKISAGVGQYYPDLGGLRKSYQEARLSLLVGTKVWGPGRVYHIKQVGMYVTLANIAQERKAELAHQILYPLLRDEQLYKTVQTFLNSGLNLTEAAEKLHVHRNTLIYRLDKTKKVIGLDPRVFDDALQIKLGLMFYQEA